MVLLAEKALIICFGRFHAIFGKQLFVYFQYLLNKGIARRYLGNHKFVTKMATPTNLDKVATKFAFGGYFPVRKLRPKFTSTG